MAGAVRPVPLKFYSTFNIHNYYQENAYLGSFGNQRLVGKLIDNGGISYGDEVVHGDETIYGDSSTTSEPTVVNITDPNNLTDHHLVTKYYTDYKLQHPATEPIVTTLTSNSLLTDKQLVSKTYADYRTLNPTTEPLLASIRASNLLTNNHLVSKSYVDTKITAEININNTSTQLYPTRLVMGKSYSPGADAYNSLDIQNGLVYIKFKSTAYRIYTCCFDINYYINRSPPNGYADAWYGNSKTSIYQTATYLVNWFYDDNGAWLNKTTFYLLDGTAIHNNFSFEGQTIKFVSFGLINNVPSISIGFPTNYDNLTTKDGWVSNHGISIELNSSQPSILGQTLTNNNDVGIAYFSNTV